MIRRRKLAVSFAVSTKKNLEFFKETITSSINFVSFKLFILAAAMKNGKNCVCYFD